jgi:hypothetical protein
MSINDLRHLKTGGLIAGAGGSSGNLTRTTKSATAGVFRNVALTFTSTPASASYYGGVGRTYSTQQPAAIQGGSGPSSSLGRARDHHTTMTTQQSSSDALRPSDLRHDDTNAKRKAGTNQRGKASRDESPGARMRNCIRAFSSGGLKRYPARAAALSTRPGPSTRRATSHASNHTTTHRCHAA